MKSFDDWWETASLLHDDKYKARNKIAARYAWKEALREKVKAEGKSK